MVGCDFEVFVYDFNNQVVDCSQLLPDYTKKNPLIINNYLITHDRHTLECSIPAYNHKNYKSFYIEIKKAFIILNRFLKTLGEYTIKIKDCIILKKYIKYNKGFEQNIYHNKFNQSNEVISNISSAGLHLHFDNVNKYRVIKRLDYTLGLYYKILYFRSKRKEYGKLGSYRDKQYNTFTKGFEYRTLGGVMLKNFNLFIISIIINIILNYERS